LHKINNFEDLKSKDDDDIVKTVSKTSKYSVNINAIYIINQ